MYHQQQQQQHHQSQFYRPAPYTAAQESTTSPANPAPQVHRHLPPAIHCPPKRQQPESPVPYNIPTGPEVHRPPKRVHESPVPYNIPTGPEVHRPPKRVQHQQPALVSPSAAASPRTPQPCHPSSLTSSPPRHHQAVTPVCKNTSNAAAEIVSTANLVTSKPPRPYTEYTMFYQLEREYILRRLLTNDDDKKSNSSPSDDDAADGQTALFQNDPLMPAQFRDLPLRADWYISGKSKKPTKRKHRKSHGKIGFLELSQIIAKRWKTLSNEDPETLQFVQKIAKIELAKYHQEMKEYKELIKCLGPAVAVEVPIVGSPPPVSIVPKSSSINDDDTIIHSNTTPPAQRRVTPIYSYPPPVYNNNNNMGQVNVINTIGTHSLPPFNFYNQEAPTPSIKLQPKAPFRRNISVCSDIDLEVDMNDDLILDLWRSCNNQEAA